MDFMCTRVEVHDDVDREVQIDPDFKEPPEG